MSNSRITVVYPDCKEPVYEIAANEFAIYWAKVTGKKPVTKKCGKALPKGNLVLIGNDAVNPLIRDMIINAKIKQFNFRYGTDDYEFRSIREGNRNLLLVSGASGRSTLFAVYDFFRKKAGVEYFWDGDVIPAIKTLSITELNVVEKPRFEYRGLRYFAHRGLHRFQAEHWDFEDWKHEIDWMVKKRFNFFMLRTGLDDLFQRAFDLPYPPIDKADTDRTERSYNDRTSFWPLKYRGELRKKVMRYAFDRGLLHPADTGTITHWYSHTPSSFYKKHPNFPFLKQSGGSYTNLKSAKIWDIYDQRSWDAYWSLTESMIKEWGEEQARMFHTIGLAERSFGKDRAENFRIKLFALRKIEQEIRERYPDAPILLAGWDFWMQWENKEVKELLKGLDPEKTILFDYTADDFNRTTYKDWNVYKKFPWIFGIFQGYARENEILNDYNKLSKRLEEVNKDPKCKGLVTWPEISHTDTFMLEYLAENSWCADDTTLQHAIKRYTKTRYNSKLSKAMKVVWEKALTITQTGHWNLNHSDRETPQVGIKSHFRILSNANGGLMTMVNSERTKYYNSETEKMLPILKGAAAVCKNLAELAKENVNNELWKRDAIDIVRTILERAYYTSLLCHCISREEWKNGNTMKKTIQEHGRNSKVILDALGDILETSDDFSLNASLKRLAKTAPLNPHSELTLKANIENIYCRTQVYELVRYLFKDELKKYLDWTDAIIAKGKINNWVHTKELDTAQEKLRDKFYNTPLEKMRPRNMHKSGEEFGKLLSEIGDKLCNIFNK